MLGIKLLWFGYVFGLFLVLGFFIFEVLIGVLVIYMIYGIVVCIIFMLVYVLELIEFFIFDGEFGVIDDEWVIC